MAEKGRPAQRYRVLDRTGAVVAEGNVNECAERIGRSVSFIRDAANFRHSYPEYWVFPVSDPQDAALIKAWDTLTEPLRKEFGIPRYNPDQEVKR